MHLTKILLLFTFINEYGKLLESCLYASFIDIFNLATQWENHLFSFIYKYVTLYASNRSFFVGV